MIHPALDTAVGNIHRSLKGPVWQIRQPKCTPQVVCDRQLDCRPPMTPRNRKFTNGAPALNSTSNGILNNGRHEQLYDKLGYMFFADILITPSRLKEVG